LRASVIEQGLSPLLLFLLAAHHRCAFIAGKTAVLQYVMFFGYYPIIKSLAERVRPVILNWVIKLAVFEAAFSVIWFLFKSLIFDSRYLETHIIVIYLAGTAAFIVFDIGLTRLIGFYIHRISKNIRKNNR
jgi:hypothetical protein